MRALDTQLRQAVLCTPRIWGRKKHFYFPPVTVFQTGSVDSVRTFLLQSPTTVDGEGQVIAGGAELVWGLLFQSPRRCVLSIILHSPALVPVVTHRDIQSVAGSPKGFAQGHCTGHRWMNRAWNLGLHSHLSRLLPLTTSSCSLLYFKGLGWP